MFRVSPETATSAATFNARSSQARPQPSQSDGFSALVDSNAPDSQRDATSTQDTQTQRRDGSDTPPKADNRPDTRADSRTDDTGKKTLKSSKSNSKADDNGEAGAKANSGPDSKASSKAATKADSNASAVATASANAGKDGADAAASLTEDAAAAALAKAGKIEISADAKVVAASGDAAKADATKTSADGKAKDADATDAATPVIPVVLGDAAAIVAVAIPVTAATTAPATTTPKTDAQIAGIEVASNPSAAAAAALATVVASAAATADTKAAVNPDTPATPVNPAASPANSSAVPTATDASVAASADDAASTAAAKTQTQAQPLVATDISAPDVNVAAADATTAQPIVPTKPKAAAVAANSDKTALTDTETAADSSSALSLPGQTAEAKAPRGAEHAKSESDKVASADKPDATPSDAKPANAPAPVAHHAPAVARPAPDDLSLQPVQNQQTPAPQAQTQNFTVTPAVPLNATLANTPVPVSGLAVDIALRAAGGSSRFEIRLDPAELGRIDVRLDVDKHGNVTSHLTVEKPATLDMLRRDAPQLQQALEDAGLKTGDSGLQFSLRDQSSGRNDDNGSGRNSQRLIISEDDTVPAQVAGRTYGRTLGSSSGVDIRV